MIEMMQNMRELRRNNIGTLSYTSGCGEGGQAQWINISRTGAALLLGRYLRPGRKLYLEDHGDEGAPPLVIPAEIVWCAPIPGTLQFRAGLRIHRVNPEIALHVAGLGYTAQLPNKNDRNAVVDAGRSTFDDTKRPLPNAAVTSLTAAV